MSDDQLFGQAVAQFRANVVLLDRFQLHGILGRSAVCLTWLATEKRAQRFVGLKFIAEPIRRFPEHLEDLDRASRFVRPLKHRHIASVYEFVVTHEWAAFSMEAVDGETLAQMVAKEPYGVFDIAKLSSYITEVCLALHYAHDQGVIHDDIKPSNIMREAESGHIKVMDFHIGRAINNAAANVVRRLTPVEQLPQNDFILRHGSAEALKFISPQRAYGIEPTPLDDIYSLGATIYFLLTGSLPVRPEHLLNPIEATTPAKMSLKLRENGIRNRFIPASWDTTIAACLERKHQNRPQSILEFAHALDLDLGISYYPPEEKKTSPSAVEVASNKEQQESPSDLQAFRFPATHSKHLSEQSFFAATPAHTEGVRFQTDPVNASGKVGFFKDSEIPSIPSNNQIENLASRAAPNPSPVAQPAQSAPTPANPSATSTEKKSTQPQETHQPPNFSRGPRSAPPSPAKQEGGEKTDIHASASAVNAAPPSDSFASPPPRPAAYTPPPTSAKPTHQTDVDWGGASYSSSSPFPEDPSDQIDQSQPTDTSASSKTKGSVEDPLPYEEIDEKDFRTSAAKQSRKSSYRSDPSNQRSRYAQRTRNSSHDRHQTNNFNPPPPYAYQQQAPPPPSSDTPTGIPTKKISNWQSNAIKVLLALFIFYACVFTIWFGLIKLGLLPEENYLDRLAQIFKKRSKQQTIASTQADIPENQYAHDLPTPSESPPASVPPPLPPPANIAFQPGPSPTPPRPEDFSPTPPPPHSPPISSDALLEVQPQDHHHQLAQDTEPAIPPSPSDPHTVASKNSVTVITGPAKIVPDEYIQIQAAIDAASPGETIRIKSGVYTENIIFKEGTKIIGEGMDVVTLQCPPTTPAIDIRNIQNGHIEGITIKHTEILNTENTPPLVNITNSNVEIIRCRIQNSSGTGVHIANGSRPTLRQNIIENNNLFGISVMDPGTVPIIERNQINNNQRVGLVFSNGASGTATGNIIKQNQWDGIAVLNPATNPTIQQNITIENQRRGIFFAKGAGGIADGNTSERNKMNGISILDEGTAPIISNNRVSNNELRGIHFGKGAKGIARGNISENNGDIGILIVDEGTRPELHNNTARNNEGWGIAIAQEALPPPSSGNIARGNKQGQINFEQTR